METLQYALRKFLYSIPLLFGVTLIAFTLMVYFGPDQTYQFLSKNPTQEEIERVRSQLGYDQPFLFRYARYLGDLATLNLGNSNSSGERVTQILAKHIPVSVALALPGFVLSVVLGVSIALIAAFYRGSWVDKGIMVFAVIGMSISFLIVVIAFQIIFCSAYGLNWFPVQGWDVDSIGSYLAYVTVPTLAIVFVALGYNTRFYRAVIVEEMNRDYVRTARAFGASPVKLLFKHVLKNAMIPIITRVIITLPFIVIGGNIIIEKYFSIPGIGQITLEAIISGDLPIVKAVVALTAILYVFALILTDISYKIIDPRVSYK